MTEMRSRTGQGGSIVPFIVVGVVLVVLVIGGIYTLQHRSQDEKGSPTVGTTDTASPQPNGSTATPRPSSSPSSPRPSASPAPSKAPSIAQNGQNGSQMPATGPEDMMPAGLLLAVLVGLATSFIQSRILAHRESSSLHQ